MAPIISRWISWNPKIGHSIHLGQDRILSLGDSTIFSIQLLTFLHSLHIFFLFQPTDLRGTNSITHCWRSSGDLGLPSPLDSEWDLFTLSLQSTSILLQDREDTLLWTGGDSSGRLTSSNIYAAITNKQWSCFLVGWRKNIWGWNLPLKLKIFPWISIKKQAKYLGYPLEKRMDRTKLLPTLSQGGGIGAASFF